MATFSVRIDNQTKTAFDKFCEASGLTISGAINIFIKAVVKENKIPFEITGEQKISDDPFWQNPENVQRLKASVDEIEKGNFTVHELIEN